MPDYPGSLYTKTTVTDDPGGTEIVAAHHNDQEDEILAIETELGTDVAGSLTNLKTRLAVAIADNGTLKFADSSVLTITSGAITVTQNWHRIATEGGAATDDLATINGLAADGTVVFIRPSAANDIVIKHNTGNIVSVGGVDITLADTNEHAILIYDTNLTKWIAGKLASGTSLSTAAAAADNFIAVYTAAATVEGTDNLQWNGTTLTIGDGTAATDYILTFNGETNDTSITWMEDEDYLLLADDVVLPDNEAVKFGTGVDASILYNGTNLIIKPDDVGTGKVVISTAQAGALTIGAGTAGVDYNVVIDGETNDLTLTWMEDETYLKSTAPIRGATSLYRRYYHLPLYATNPGVAGATFIPPDANTTGGNRLDAASELLYAEADVHADWDAASDLTVEIRFVVNVNNTGGGAGDTVDLKLVCYYNGLTETATKTQTVEVATTVGQAAQYKVFEAVFTIDFDAALNVVEVGDEFGFILNLETDSSEVDDIIVTGGSFSYLTTHFGIETGDS